MNNKKIQISFIVPVYNVKPYLEKCLGSIIRTNVEKEIILIDDGSTDGSREVLEYYQTRYSYITLVCQSNKWVAAARNIGIKLARGEYIQFVDSDDFLLTEDYEKLITQAKLNNANVLRGQCLWDLPEGKQIVPHPPVLADLGVAQQASAVCVSGKIFIIKMLSDFFPAVWLGFFRTELLQKNNIFFDESVQAAEDHAFLLDIFTRDDVNVIEVFQPIYGYHLRLNSASRNSSTPKVFEEMFSGCQILRERYQQAITEGKSDVSYIAYSVLMLNYLGIYQYHYQPSSDELKAKVRHLFTDDVIGMLEKHLGHKLVL